MTKGKRIPMFKVNTPRIGSLRASTSSVRTLCLLCVSVLNPLTLAPGNSRADEPVLRFAKPILGLDAAEEALVAVPLDAEVYAATQEDLDDVRVLDADGDDVPLLLRMVPTTKSRVERTTWTGREPSVRPLEDGGLEIVIELHDHQNRPLPHGLNIVTPLINFEQGVRVETSADGQNWEPAAETVIFDYTRYMDVRNVSVPFTETTDRWFRITIDDVTAEQQSQLLELTRRLQGDEETGHTERLTVDRRPFRIDRIEFWREVERPQASGAAHSAYPLAGFEVAQDVEEQETHVIIETQREPLTSFRLETPSRNFSRRVIVQVEYVDGVRQEWRALAEATLLRIDFRNLSREELVVTFPQTRADRYRLVIENRDSPPLEVTGIAAEGTVYEAVFFAEPEREYRLAYGDELALAPHYDVAAIEALLLQGVEPQPAALAAEQPLSAAGPRATTFRDLLNSKPLLIGLVIVLVLSLGWGLYHAVQRMETLPKNEPPS